MTERNIKIRALVDELRTLLAPFACVGVRTDYTVTPQQVNRRTVVPERHGAGSRYALISSRETLRPKGIFSLVNFLGASPEQANRILDVTLELSELNDVGAWPLEVDQRETKEANQIGVGEKRYSALPGYGARFMNVRYALPQIATIEIFTHTGKRASGSSRKGWMHFYNAEGDQVCAISTNLLATSVREWFGEDQAKRITADRHLGRWANQANADLHRFIEAASNLLHFDSAMGVTRINLKEV